MEDGEGIGVYERMRFGEKLRSWSGGDDGRRGGGEVGRREEGRRGGGRRGGGEEGGEEGKRGGGEEGRRIVETVVVLTPAVMVVVVEIPSGAQWREIS